MTVEKLRPIVVDCLRAPDEEDSITRKLRAATWRCGPYSVVRRREEYRGDVIEEVRVMPEHHRPHPREWVCMSLEEAAELEGAIAAALAYRFPEKLPYDE